jgi:hypothetical protein
MQRIIEQVANALETILKRAQGGIAVLLPLLVAMGFATASASAFVNGRYGPEQGNLIIAGGFAVISLLAYAIARRGNARSSLTREATEPAKLVRQTPLAALMDATSLESVEAELVKTLTAAAPDAARQVLQQAPKNLHLILGASIGLFIASRLAKSIRSGEGT